MTPDQHGYVKCARCGVWRPESEAETIDDTIDGVRVRPRVCRDTAWCSAQVGVGKGEMDGATS